MSPRRGTEEIINSVLDSAEGEQLSKTKFTMNESDSSFSDHSPKFRKKKNQTKEDLSPKSDRKNNNVPPKKQATGKNLLPNFAERNTKKDRARLTSHQGRATH